MNSVNTRMNGAMIEIEKLCCTVLRVRFSQVNTVDVII